MRERLRNLFAACSSYSGGLLNNDMATWGADENIRTLFVQGEGEKVASVFPDSASVSRRSTRYGAHLLGVNDLSRQ